MNKTITLDWDLEFDDIRNSVSFGILKRFVRANRKDVAYVWIRRSSNGNAHVRVEMVNPQSEMSLFFLRAWLRDDPVRLKLDMIRSMLEHPESFDKTFPKNFGSWKPAGAGGTGRLWDWKVEGGVAHETGPWEEVRF